MSEPTPASLRIAVLLDCDNVSPKYAGLILEELATYGTPTIKRAYGDWTTTNLNGWKKALNELAIQPVQQFAYTIGKNSSDSALIIDAMDLLWMGNVDAFALVSSDSDFTRLATRLRESGKRVIGLGARKTPASLRNAVDQFIYLELLGTHTEGVDDDEPAPSLQAELSPKDEREAKEGPATGNRRGSRGRGAKAKPAADVASEQPAEAEPAPVVEPAPDVTPAPESDEAAPQRAVRGRGRGAGRGSVLVDVDSAEVITAEDPTPPDVRADADDDAEPASRINLQSALVKAVNATSGDDGWASLSLIGQHMSRTHVDFDPRDFGHAKLSTLVADQPYLETRTEGRSMEVTLKQRRRRAQG